MTRQLNGEDYFRRSIKHRLNFTPSKQNINLCHSLDFEKQSPFRSERGNRKRPSRPEVLGRLRQRPEKVGGSPSIRVFRKRSAWGRPRRRWWRPQDSDLFENIGQETNSTHLGPRHKDMYFLFFESSYLIKYGPILPNHEDRWKYALLDRPSLSIGIRTHNIALTAGLQLLVFHFASQGTSRLWERTTTKLKEYVRTSVKT